MNWFDRLHIWILQKRHRGEKYLFNYSELEPFEKERVQQYLKAYKYYWKVRKERNK